MGISLAKGQRVSLEKVSPGLKNIFIGLGWDLKATDTGSDFDLDGSAFLLGSNGKLVSENHFIFYNNLQSPDPDKSVRAADHHRDAEIGFPAIGGGDQHRRKRGETRPDC